MPKPSIPMTDLSQSQYTLSSSNSQFSSSLWISSNHQSNKEEEEEESEGGLGGIGKRKRMDRGHNVEDGDYWEEEISDDGEEDGFMIISHFNQQEQEVTSSEDNQDQDERGLEEEILLEDLEDLIIDDNKPFDMVMLANKVEVYGF